MKSVMKHQFSQVPKATIPRSTFDRSHAHKTTFDSGALVPILCDLAYPGDTFNVQLHGFGRLATPIFPIMDNIFLDTHFYAVPIRLVWDNFQKAMGEQDNPGDSTDFTVPQMVTPAGGATTGELSDYMGIPVGVVGLSHSSLWHRAYNLIWNEWYRDQNLQNSVVVDKDDGPDTYSDYVLLKRGKRHDYFTSALPWPQKGDAVSLPLGTSAPVTGIGAASTGSWITGPASALETDATSSTPYAVYKTGAPAFPAGMIMEEDPNNTGYPNIRTDLTNATAATINELRQAFQIQKMLERDARGGTRYTEIIHSHFSVKSPDARIQRPEYLGGGTSYVNVSPIAQTSSTDATTPQGNLAAMGAVHLDKHGFVKSFTEHCLIIGLVSARGDLTYQQGLNRMFSIEDRYDFLWPSLTMIGEQAILNKEIYADGSANDDNVFGYQERYAELRYKPSLVTGLMRSNPTSGSSLDSWHLSQDFSSLPTLSSTFIEEDPPVDRCIAVPTEPHFILDTYIKMICARPLPTYGVPGLIDHF